MFRLFLSVEVVEVAEKLIKPVIGRQHVITIAQVVFAKLAGDVTLSFKQHSDRRILFFYSLRSTGKTDFGKAGANGRLARDEGGASRGAGLLPIPVGEESSLLGDAVDVGCFVAHHAHVVGADVELTDVVTPDDQNVGLFGFFSRGREVSGDNAEHRDEEETEINHGC